MRVVIFCLIISVVPALADTGLIQRESRILNGRNYVLKLSQVTDVSMYDLRPLFESLKLNLPREGALSEFYSSKDSMAKLAGYACDIMDFMEGPNLDLETLYQRFINRRPTTDEITKRILIESGELDVFSNCLLLSMHPEFILIQN